MSAGGPPLRFLQRRGIGFVTHILTADGPHPFESIAIVSIIAHKQMGRDPTRDSGGGAGHQYDLAYHTSLRKQLLGLFRLGQRKALGDDWLDFLLPKKVKQGD